MVTEAMMVLSMCKMWPCISTFILPKINHLFFQGESLTGWFARLFPGISFPAQRVSEVTDRAEAQFKALPKDGGDVKTFLQEEHDLDFVSEMLSNLDLKRGHLLADAKAVKPPEGFECTNSYHWPGELQKQRKTCTKVYCEMGAAPFQWRKHQWRWNWKVHQEGHWWIQDYKPAQSTAPDKVAAFLSSRFSVARSRPSSSTSQPLPPSDNQILTKKLQRLQQEKDFLLQCSVSMHKDIQNLQDTVHELQAEKMKLLEVPNTIHELEQELDRLRESSNTQKRTSQLRYNTKRWACNEAKRRLKWQQRENDEIRATQNQLQRNVELLRRELERERQRCTSFCLEAQQLAEELNMMRAADQHCRWGASACKNPGNTEDSACITLHYAHGWHV